jgi:hypothetical protein
MSRWLIVATIAMAVSVGSLSTDLSACGDKFLRAGRSARLRHYASIHPSRILLYAPAPAWSERGVRDFEAMLRRAGHKTFAVRQTTGLAETLAAGKYDLVIALYADAVIMRPRLDSVSGAPALLPVLYKPSATLATEAEKSYPLLIRPDKMDKFQALEKIDDLLSRVAKTSAAAGTH